MRKELCKDAAVKRERKNVRARNAALQRLDRVAQVKRGVGLDFAAGKQRFGRLHCQLASQLAIGTAYAFGFRQQNELVGFDRDGNGARGIFHRQIESFACR